MTALALTARALADARLSATSLSGFPGPLPTTLDEAYAIQRAVIDLWPSRIAGWKVGRLSADLAQRFGVDRFIGPVFEDAVVRVSGQGTADFPMFAQGSAAFEAEFVVFVGEGPEKALVAQAMTTGIEIAASPIATLPALGSLATIADLGNNAGQIIGYPVALDLLGDPQALPCETRIGDAPAVSATAAALPGGPATALRFALAQAEAIGLPVEAGQFVSTGAVTGMHAVRPGQSCSADFARFGRIECMVRAIEAVRGGPGRRGF